MEDMVSESVKYTILGMGVVFLFLYVLVLSLRLQKKLIARYFPEDVKSVEGMVRREPVQKETERHKKKEVVAMMAAIYHHKKRRNSV